MYNLAIFGAGYIGKQTKKLVEEKYSNEYKLIYFVDNDPAKQGSLIENVPVISAEKLLQLYKKEIDYVALSMQKDYAYDVNIFLSQHKIVPINIDSEGVIHRSRLESVVLSNEATKKIGKDWVSASSYYDKAEDWLNTFWAENTVFYKSFCKLDCTNIVELACGHGRHVQKYLEKAKIITLIDINQENIDFCKKRYSNEEKVKYLVNNGNNFKGVDSNSQTAIFTYDAMVHFELLDILEYLKEANRVLVNGGKILFHHSNAAFLPELKYNKKPHGRNFMSADIFAYLALRTGFIVLQQDIFSWGESKDIDCLSLCQKAR
jgi:ubiquinone/menaquinone biosynthesis C-methylase UbiE